MSPWGRCSLPRYPRRTGSIGVTFRSSGGWCPEETWPAYRFTSRVTGTAARNVISRNRPPLLTRGSTNPGGASGKSTGLTTGWGYMVGASGVLAAVLALVLRASGA